LDRQITYQKIGAAARFIRQGAFFLASNPDKTFPAPDGLLPGAGTIIAAVQAASEAEPVYAGKPYPGLYNTAIAMLGCRAERALAVGDRLDTDILGGVNAGCKTALVLTGVSQRTDLETCPYQPDLIINTLEDLLKD
jgi:4-nitrophenyl phosphatase